VTTNQAKVQTQIDVFPELQTKWQVTGNWSVSSGVLELIIIITHTLHEATARVQYTPHIL